jgi:hypothetical protein
MPAPVVAMLVVLLAAPAGAREIAGVELPETVRVGDTTLRLNGAGVRTRLLFKVYAAGLYLTEPTRDASAVLRTDAPRRIELRMLRDVDGRTIAESIADGFARNAGDALPALEERLRRFEALFPAAKAGDAIVLTYLPDRGTVVEAQGRERGVIEGKDFAGALFAVWLGGDPVDANLKRALLGG